MRNSIRSLFGALLVLVLGPPAFAQCEWDQRFSSPLPGLNGTVRALALFDDGSGPALYAGGEFTTAGGVSAARIARWDGTSWSALGAPGSGMDGSVWSLAVFDDGSGPALYAGGTFATAGGVSAPRIARWDGTSWSTLGATGSVINNGVVTLAVFDDGAGPALYAGGSFTTAGGVFVPRIARWDGTSWSALGAPGSGMDDTVTCLAVFDDGSGPALYAGGEFTTAGGVAASRIARWDGTSWSALGAPGSGMDAPVWSLAVFDDGFGPELYAGGSFTTAGSVSASSIAVWDGTSWSALGAPGSGTGGTVYSLAVFDAGSGLALHAGGTFTTAGGVSTPRIARWDGTSWSALGAPGTGMNNTVRCLGVFDDGAGSALYAAGEFTTAGGAFAGRIAKWDGTSLSAIATPGSGLSGSVRCFAVFDDGSGPALYAGGTFTIAGGVSAWRIARWDGTSWSALGPPGTGMNNTVRCLGVFDDGSGTALYAGGDFTTVGGVSAPRIARWDGTIWSTLGIPGNWIDSPVLSLAVFDDGSGTALYAGGDFATAGGVSAPRIARWDGTSWSALGSPGNGMNDWIWSLAVFDDGSGPALYAAGDFTTAGGLSIPRIARWDGTSWSALGAPGSGMDGIVFALAVFDDGSGPALYAGGEFTTAGGVSAPKLARWNGTSWSALGSPGSGMDDTVWSLTVFDDGSGSALYAGGDFTSAGGVSASHVARWNGTSWSALGMPGSGTSSTVTSFAAFDDGRDAHTDLYLGGFFASAGGFDSSAIAQWHGCASTPVALCFGEGSGAACPCGNAGLAGHGCDNSAGTGGALLSATGTTEPDTLVLAQSGELSSSLSIFLQGSVELAVPVPFGDGLRCAGGSLKRLYVKNASGGAVAAPEAGDPSISARSAALGDPLAPGATRAYQVYYRDPDLAFCASPQGDAFNVGNALRVVW